MCVDAEAAVQIELRRKGEVGAVVRQFTWDDPHLGLTSVVAAMPIAVARPAAASSPAASATPETTGTLSSTAPSGPLELAAPSALPSTSLPLEPETLVKGLLLDLCDQYQISPQMIWQQDITLGSMILTAISITSRPDRKIYAERCDGSGVKLLQLMYTLSATT